MPNRLGSSLTGLILVMASMLADARDASAQKRPPLDPTLHPVVQAIRELWSGIELNVVRGAGSCRIQAPSIRLVVRPFDRQSSGVTDGQKRSLLVQIKANIGRLARGGLDDYEVLKSRRNLSDAELLHQVHFIVTPVIVKVASGSGWSYRFFLHAEHARTECGVTGSEVLLDEEHVAEPIYPPDTMFNEVAQRLLEEQDAGDVRVLVRQPRFDDREADEEQWDTVIIALQKSLQTARDNPIVVTAASPRVSAHRAPKELQDGASGTWVADVRMRPERSNRLRTEIQLRDGRDRQVGDIVYADAAPFTVRSLTLSRQATAAGAAPPLLPFSDRPQYVRNTVQAGTPPQRLSVEVASQAVLELDLKSLSGNPVGMALTSEDGRQVQTTDRPASRPGLARYMLRRGLYVLHLSPPASGTTDYLLRVRGTSGTLPGEPSGTVVQTAGDWVVGTHQGQAGRECFAATNPVDLSPEIGWRPVGPVFQFRLARANGARRGAGERPTMVHLFDAARFYDPTRSLQAVLVLPDGRQETLPVGQDPDGRIGSFRACSESPGGGCLISDPESIWKLSRGRQLVIAGVSPDGRATRIVYSLRGYTAAMNALSAICEDPDVAERLVPPR